MKLYNKILHFLTLISVLFVSCQKDNTLESESRILFSIDLDVQKFDTDYKKAYIAAYTSDGKLINYGSLSDSTKWELEADFKKDIIDIVYFEIWHKNSLKINHIRNINIPQSFTDPNKLEPDPFLNQTKHITLKVEDFGNRDENSTGSTPYENRPHKHNRGNSHPYGEFIWDEVKEDYTYKSTYIDLNPDSQGLELTIFERGTNKPYISYINIPATNINSGDTITLHKSDFKLGELKTIQVNSSYNDFDNIFLYTYNSKAGKRELITSFEDVVPNSSNIKSISYVNSNDILPIDYWDFRYFAKSANTTSYTIRSNNVMPSFIDIKELSSSVITKLGNQFDFTHGNIFLGKNIARSTVQFSKKNNESNFSYSLYFEGSESIGNTKIIPFDIPEEILNEYSAFKELNSLEWRIQRYNQTYTNIPENSPLNFLKNSILNWKDNNSSNQEYSYETFSIEF